MKPTYPMSSEYDGLDQEYQLLLEENRDMATKIEVLENTLQSLRSTDAEMVVRYNLMMSVYEAMCGHNEDIYHAKALAFADPQQMKEDIEADFPEEDWMKIWEHDYPFVHGTLTWERVMEILNGIPKQLPPGQLKIERHVNYRAEVDRLRTAIVDTARNMEAADPVYLQGFIKDLYEILEE